MLHQFMGFRNTYTSLGSCIDKMSYSLKNVCFVLECKKSSIVCINNRWISTSIIVQFNFISIAFFEKQTINQKDLNLLELENLPLTSNWVSTWLDVQVVIKFLVKFHVIVFDGLIYERWHGSLVICLLDCDSN